MNITIIGFGEAGPVFGKQFLDNGATVTAWDKLQLDSATANQQIAKTQSLGIRAAASMHDAVSSAELIVSTVTASQAPVAAEQAADALMNGCHWLDLNSVSPATKRQVHDSFAHKGVLFTEGVAMDTVPSKGAQVPLIFCGPESMSLSKTLNKFGLNTRSVSAELGAASTTKLLRSILIKGMEALFAESIEAAGKVDMQDEVLASLQATYPGLDWQEVAGYQLYRASLHAERRASEMREAEKLVKELGVESLMTSAIVERQQNLSDRNIGSGYPSDPTLSVSEFVNAVAQSESR